MSLKSHTETENDDWLFQGELRAFQMFRSDIARLVLNMFSSVIYGRYSVRTVKISRQLVILDLW